MKISRLHHLACRSEMEAAARAYSAAKMAARAARALAWAWAETFVRLYSSCMHVDGASARRGTQKNALRAPVAVHTLPEFGDSQRPSAKLEYLVTRTNNIAGIHQIRHFFKEGGPRVRDDTHGRPQAQLVHTRPHVGVEDTLGYHPVLTRGGQIPGAPQKK